MDDVFAAGDRFLLAQARLLERRLFATCFRAAPASGVVDALRGYQNADGGFGQALEPDTRCPASLPVYVETALQALATAATVDRAMVLRACDFLARTANEAGTGGAVPLAFPVIESFPRAGHWTEWTYEPGLNPTAGLAGLLYQLGVEHSWRTDATRYCWERLEVRLDARQRPRPFGGARLPRARARARTGGCLRGGDRPSSGRGGRSPSRPRDARLRAVTSSLRADAPPRNGAGCSPMPRSMPPSTISWPAKSRTADGPSAGNRPARPPGWNGGGS